MRTQCARKRDLVLPVWAAYGGQNGCLVAYVASVLHEARARAANDVVDRFMDIVDLIIEHV